jgi:nucleotide-binding universal stress UspA family protein
MIKRILVGLAGTNYTPVAIERAVTLAQAHDAESTGVTVLDARRVRSRAAPAEDADATSDRRIAVTQARIAESIRDFELACQTASIKHRVVAESGDAFTTLVDLARYHDLIVFGLRSVFEYDFLAGAPESLLIRLVGAGVRPLIAVSEKFRSISRVVIAYSGTMESAKAMKRFVQMRLWPDAKLRVVTFEHQADKAEQLVGDAADYCRAHGFEPEEAFVPDSPKDHLLPYALEWGADLTVVGNSAKNLLLRRIFGETALHAIQNANRPLFLAQ